MHFHQLEGPKYGDERKERKWLVPTKQWLRTHERYNLGSGPRLCFASERDTTCIAQAPGYFLRVKICPLPTASVDDIYPSSKSI